MKSSSRAGRKARTPLPRELVLAAAVALADREGLPAVTMRRLATALDVEAMSIYHHIAGKEALLDGLVEGLAREIDVEIGLLPAASGWRHTLRARCLAARVVMLRHRWAPDLIGSRPAIPVALYQHFEGTLATMVEAGMSYHLAHRAMHALNSMVLGFVHELFSPAGDAAATDAPEAQLAAMAATLPHITAMVTSEVHAAGDTLGWCDSQAEFEFTLDILLEGIDRRHRAERRARASDR